MRELFLDCSCFNNQNLWLEIVEHDNVCACTSSSERLLSAAALDLNLDAEAAQGTGGFDGGRNAAGGSDVVVLEHDLNTHHTPDDQ
jgi:hypothetical protein